MSLNRSTSLAYLQHERASSVRRYPHKRFIEASRGGPRAVRLDFGMTAYERAQYLSRWLIPLLLSGCCTVPQPETIQQSDPQAAFEHCMDVLGNFSLPITFPAGEFCNQLRE